MLTDYPTKQAIVIGGSIAGLLAAQVLSQYFNRVIVIESDRFPEQPKQRQGVPQARHVHVMLARGQQILEQFFPGIQAELAAAGTPLADATADCLWFGPGGFAPRFWSGLTLYNCSRNLLEWAIRRRLTANNRVVFVPAGQVTDLLSDSSKTSVTGVRVRWRKDAGSTETDFSADLVVDASGRNSRAPQWLKAMGYAPPQETVINSFLGYASRWYQPPEGFSEDWQAVLISAKSPGTRGGVIYTVEGNRWVVTLSGINRDYPPTDEAGFLDFACSLRSPILYEAIKNAQPLSPIYAYQRTENRWRHYEKLSKFPEGFVLVGDAVCAFNPVYGQGMTTAALGALTLDECLKKQNGNFIGLSRQFQKQLCKVIVVPWMMSTGEDLRWPSTEGRRPNLIARLLQKYLDRVLLLAAEHADIHMVFLEVMHLVKTPTAFFQPSILRRVLKQAINQHQKDEQVMPKPLSPVLEPLLKDPS